MRSYFGFTATTEPPNLRARQFSTAIRPTKLRGVAPTIAIDRGRKSRVRSMAQSSAQTTARARGSV
jgi:hypothetical protein